MSRSAENTTAKPTLQFFNSYFDPYKQDYVYKYPFREIVYNENLNPVPVTREGKIVNQGALSRRRVLTEMAGFPPYYPYNRWGNPKVYGFSHAPSKHHIGTFHQNIGSESPFYFHIRPEEMKKAEKAARNNMQKRRANQFRKTYKTNQTIRTTSPSQRRRNMTQRLRGAYGNEAGKAIANSLYKTRRKN